MVAQAHTHAHTYTHKTAIRSGRGGGGGSAEGRAGEREEDRRESRQGNNTWGTAARGGVEQETDRAGSGGVKKVNRDEHDKVRAVQRGRGGRPWHLLPTVGTGRWDVRGALSGVVAVA